MSESPPVMSPVVQYFGSQVRRLRNEKGWTQEQLGKRIGYTGAMVGYVENAKRIPTEKFVRGCDEYLEAGGVLKELWPLINRESYPNWFRPFVELEAEAVSIRKFEVQSVPGLFQTEEYARAVLGAGWPPPSADEVDRHLTARLERQKILDRNNPPLLWVVLEESVIRRPVGGTAVLDEQLKHLLDVAQKPHARLQVLPFSKGAHAAMDGSFTVLEVENGEKVLYTERPGNGQVTLDRGDVTNCDQRMSALVGSALSPEESAELIASTIGAL